VALPSHRDADGQGADPSLIYSPGNNIY
jgi:hypothetical protein